ncbi:MAG: dihydroorotase [Alphaproteobacteria bacterium]|nr:dihydroorotase [Alphaproteobacteria bacterium]
MILTLPRPDDWHVHLRDGAILRAVLPYTARAFARALVMPNLHTPITSAALARAYRDCILSSLPENCDFTPLMTLYLTDHTNADDLAQGFQNGDLFAAKLYPQGATTNAQHGVSRFEALIAVFERMEKIGMPLSIHGEVADPAVDFFDREAVFVDKILIPLRKQFPALKIILEHVTTRHAVNYVQEAGADLAATITCHHITLSRNAIFEGGLKPHHFCLPVLKREEDRLAVLKAATSGASQFFAGTDSAPHPRAAKESSSGAGGIFSAPHALGLYAQAFEKEGALDKLAAFLSHNGAAFYGVAPNTGTITLEKTDESPAPFKPILTDEGAEIISFPLTQPPLWRLVEPSSSC